VKNLKKSDWTLVVVEAGLFMMVMMVLWLDEFIDLPYRFLGAPKTPYRPQEYILETASVLVVEIVTVTITLIILRKLRQNEKFLRVCAWCRKIWVDGEWVNLEEYAVRQHSLRSTHGICDVCVVKHNTKVEHKKDGQIEIMIDKSKPHSPRYWKPLQ